MKNNFIVAALGGSGTRFLATMLNKSPTWTVEHEGSWQFERSYDVKQVDRHINRYNYGDVNGFLRFELPYYNAREYSQYKDVADYMAQMEQVFLGIERILKPSRMCVINISPVLVEREKRSEQSYRIPLPFYFVPMMEKIGFEFLEDIIWKKPDGAAANRNGGFYRHRKPVAYKPNIVTEYVLVFKKKANFLIDKG